jgi:hypothetical protein
MCHRLYPRQSKDNVQSLQSNAATSTHKLHSLEMCEIKLSGRRVQFTNPRTISYPELVVIANTCQPVSCALEYQAQGKHEAHPGKFPILN